MILKLRYGPIKAIKPQLKLLVLGFFVALGLVAADLVLAATIFEDGFETYPVGSLYGQDDWVRLGSIENWNITDTNAIEGLKSIYTPSSTLSEGYYKIGSVVNIGRVSFYVRATDITSWKSTTLIEIKGLYETSLRTFVEFNLMANGVVKYQTQAQSWFQIGVMSADTWYPIEAEWNSTTHLARVRFNSGAWTDWKGIVWGVPDRFQFRFYYVSTGTNKSWIDYIAETSDIPCSPTNCGACTTWAYCTHWEECFWDFDYSYCLPFDFCCGCGFDWEKCLFCDSQSECEEIENCYWSENFCWYAGEQCGPGLNCQLCLDEATCEAENCYWYGDFCWEEEPPAISNWATWYDNYGDYEAPAPLVNTLATGSQSFFEAIGGFLITFQKFFDLQTAFQNGKSLGEVLPKARGYLTILDGFAGSLPFGTIFMFLIMFMLAIGTFRITRALIQLIKFW